MLRIVQTENGNPNRIDATGEKLPAWEPYTVEKPWNMEFGETSVFQKEGPDPLTQFLIRQYRNNN